MYIHFFVIDFYVYGQRNVLNFFFVLFCLVFLTFDERPRIFRFLKIKKLYEGVSIPNLKQSKKDKRLHTKKVNHLTF